MDSETIAVTSRRHWLQVIALSALYFGVPERLLCMEQNDPNATVDLIKRRMENSGVFFKLPFRFLWWERGGEPGSPSDSLSLEENKDDIKGTYNRGRFDPKFQPPVHVEKFVGPVGTDKVSALLKLLFDSSAFRTHPEGDESMMRDDRKETWSFRNKDANLTRTFAEPFPEELEKARELCRQIAEELAHHQA